MNTEKKVTRTVTQKSVTPRAYIDDYKEPIWYRLITKRTGCHNPSGLNQLKTTHDWQLGQTSDVFSHLLKGHIPEEELLAASHKGPSGGAYQPNRQSGQGQDLNLEPGDPSEGAVDFGHWNWTDQPSGVILHNRARLAFCSKVEINFDES